MHYKKWADFTDLAEGDYRHTKIVKVGINKKKYLEFRLTKKRKRSVFKFKNHLC